MREKLEKILFSFLLSDHKIHLLLALMRLQSKTTAIPPFTVLEVLAHSSSPMPF
eukprot:SAG22_NODE_125_length_18883_cov_12.351629_9_plen_54_part_00